MAPPFRNALLAATFFFSGGFFLISTGRTLPLLRAESARYARLSPDDRRRELAGREFAAIFEEVARMTPEDARIRYFAPSHFLRTEGDFQLLPRNIHCLLGDTPRPEYILIIDRDIPESRLREEQQKGADPVVSYRVVKRWTPSRMLLQREGL